MLHLWPTFSAVIDITYYQINFRFNINETSEAEGTVDHVTLLRLFFLLLLLFLRSFIVVVIVIVIIGLTLRVSDVMKTRSPRLVEHIVDHRWQVVVGHFRPTELPKGAGLGRPIRVVP